MNNTEKNKGLKPQLKKYAVLAGMVIGFLISMYFIFAPSLSEKEKAKQESGFNSAIPDPHKDGIIEDKKQAYEQEITQQKQEDRMRSLEDFSFTLQEQPSVQEPAAATVVPLPEPAVEISNTGSARRVRKDKSLEQSAHAYQDITRTVGSFYQQPAKETLSDKEREDLQQKVKEMEAQLQKKETTPAKDPMEMIEKSYQLAAKYFPSGQAASSSPKGQQSKGSTISTGQAKTVSVKQPQKQVVSVLAQPFGLDHTDSAGTQLRQSGFHTLGVTGTPTYRNTLSAVIHQDQTVLDGQDVRLRLSESICVEDMELPVHTTLTGKAKIQGDRLDIVVSIVEYQGRIVPVEVVVHDSDGQRGIYIPNTLEIDAVKEIAANAGGSVGSGITFSQQKASQQLLTDLGRGVIQGTSQYAAKKIKEVKVNLKGGYRVLLLPKEEE